MQANDSPAIPAADAKLIDAVTKMQQLDLELNRLYQTHGDDADTHRDYRKLEARRIKAIETIASIPAQSPKGVRAKAEALSIRELAEDSDRALSIAQSVARDIIRLQTAEMIAS